MSRWEYTTLKLKLILVQLDDTVQNLVCRSFACDFYMNGTSCENISLPNHLQLMNLGLVPTEDKKLGKRNLTWQWFCRLTHDASTEQFASKLEREAKPSWGEIWALTRLCCTLSRSHNVQNQCGKVRFIKIQTWQWNLTVNFEDSWCLHRTVHEQIGGRSEAKLRRDL